MRGLRKIRFDGTLSFETAPVLTAFPNEMKGEVLGFINRIGCYFAEEIGEKGCKAQSDELPAVFCCVFRCLILSCLL